MLPSYVASCRFSHTGADTAAALDAESEVGVNEQIAHEYTMSYMYHAMSSYFNRDNVALPGVRCRGAAGSGRAHLEEYQRSLHRACCGGRVPWCATL